MQATLGIVCSAVFVGLIGLATRAFQVSVLLGLGGIGVAWFYPNAAALARKAIPAKPGRKAMRGLLGPRAPLALKE